MSQFIGTKEDFIKYIGGYCRNKVNSITRNERLLHNKTCEHCGRTNIELESAHISGQERNIIIVNILETFFKVNDNYYNVDLNKFEQLFIDEQTPINEHFLFLCRSCHNQYDSNFNKLSKQSIEINSMSITPHIQTDSQEKNKIIRNDDKIKSLYIQYLNKKHPNEDSSIIKLHISMIKKIMSFNKIENFLALFNNIDKLIFNIEKNKNKNNNYLLPLKSFKVFTIFERENINKIINSANETTQEPKSVACNNVKNNQPQYNNLKNKYKEWLRNHGYKEFTPSGVESTISQYIRSIEKIMIRENFCYWEEIATNIQRLVIEYSVGGKYEKFGLRSNRTPINALKRFQEFLSEIKY